MFNSAKTLKALVLTACFTAFPIGNAFAGSEVFVGNIDKIEVRTSQYPDPDVAVFIRVISTQNHPQPIKTFRIANNTANGNAALATAISARTTGSQISIYYLTDNCSDYCSIMSLWY